MICGEVFDLMQVAAMHQRVVSIIPMQTILEYGGMDASNLFSVQVRHLLYLLHLFLIVFPGQRPLQQCLWFSQPVGPAYLSKRDRSQCTIS